MIDDPLYALARDVGASLASRGVTLATAESCTGGWIAQAITDVPGSSAWFEAAIITYSNQAKHALLGVADELLQQYGAVSEEVVRAMGQGVLHVTQADWAIAVSGIAGPSGGSANKPVGTVWINWTARAGPCWSHRFRYAGDRREVRRQAVEGALQGLLEALRA
jgi:nicotinamide-nucleotide amidase